MAMLLCVACLSLQLATLLNKQLFVITSCHTRQNGLQSDVGLAGNLGSLDLACQPANTTLEATG